ncbi:MAG: protein translocase subunit SecF, partial [Candidatus Uhrbacteria bacterium]
MDIIGKRKIWFSISLISILASFLLVAVLGLNFGIDFTGGSLSEIKIESETNVAELRGTINQLGFESAQVQSSGEGNYLIRLNPLSEEEHQELLAGLELEFGQLEELRFDMIGPVIGQELKSKALSAIVAALVLILLYVAWAFRKVSEPVASWKYGLLTIIAALHDLIIPIGVFAVLGR